ncbi:hypothetical protein MFMK1_001644 [Metallumcola ferriviriculae]|uniref:Uncharacterized protein n=1 Tax=Metallumcola ferriviriculae TaxID=3039180 RepID=A0AAU0URJ8_9FIRM|nr:hypothetical protein MFMK1_001644 [Desulfitibacteraceae bacterium MK1]
MRHEVNFLLLPEGQTGVATDPTGKFATKYSVDPVALFSDAFGFAQLSKNDPLSLEVIMIAPKPDMIGFSGWKYEGWLVDQPPEGKYSSATSVHPEFGGIAHPTLDSSEYPITTGLLRDTGLTLPNGLGVFVNVFNLDQSAWPYDVVVITFEPPETGTGDMNYDPRPDPVRPITGAIPGRIAKPASPPWPMKK